TTYPSYALNLAQLGALCLSNLCATKPFGSITIFFVWPTLISTVLFFEALFAINDTCTIFPP
ncbi:hypothetical protein, partial [Acinetobacter baumannii]